MEWIIEQDGTNDLYDTDAETGSIVATVAVPVNGKFCWTAWKNSVSDLACDVGLETSLDAAKSAAVTAWREATGQVGEWKHGFYRISGEEYGYINQSKVPGRLYVTLYALESQRDEMGALVESQAKLCRAAKEGK